MKTFHTSFPTVVVAPLGKASVDMVKPPRQLLASEPSFNSSCVFTPAPVLARVVRCQKSTISAIHGTPGGEAHPFLDLTVQKRYPPLLCNIWGDIYHI